MKTIAQARGVDDVSVAQRPILDNEIDDAIGDQERHDIRLSFLMHDVSRMRRSAYDQFMKPLGITRAQWWVLAHLSRHDGMMQTQLADILEVGKASLGDVIESLEAGGWVTRRAGPTDKRVKRVYLTRPAQGLIKRMTVLEVEFNENVFADLSHAERAAMTGSLLKIKTSLARMSEAGVEATKSARKR
ncbi:MAG: MarR family transcriptional regulator [Pseudomonadota bacterium]